MDGAALRMLDSIRLAAGPGDRPCAAALEAFACLVYGKPPELLGTGERVLVETVAREASVALDRSSRPSRARAFGETYRLIEGKGVATDAHAGRSHPTLALEGLLALPVSQRVALALSCVAGFTDEEVASVIGISLREVRSEMENGIAAVRSASKEGGVRVRGETGEPSSEARASHAA